MEVEFKVKPGSVILYHNLHVVILKASSIISMPIWIGRPEAEAIECELVGAEMPRPMTHDLMKNLLIMLGHPVTKIVITELTKEGTYRASIFVDQGGVEVPCDCRPSDAIALALRFGAKMFIEDSVLMVGLDNEPTRELLEFLEKVAPALMSQDFEV